ncbi:hypothetical protein ACFWUP_27440 [Nocardia sp. NPDC058658]|uniref:hypothetical protein n=1 Tax=Nocardia sp. NPDC058658 TaxID=3346580 RepID=UPI0036546F7C
MTEHLLNDMARMNAYVQQLSQIIDSAGSGAAKSAGRDSTGTIQVTVGHDGGLLDIVVSEEWTQRLHTSDLGAAVVEAVRIADSQRHAATMMALADPGVLESLRRVDLNSVMARPVEPPQTRPSSELLSEDAVHQLEKPISHGIPASTGQATVGTDAQAQVTLDTRGIVECNVSVAWGQPVSGATIARAIQLAYADALHAPREDDSATPSIDSLIEQALGELSAMQYETPGATR